MQNLLNIQCVCALFPAPCGEGTVCCDLEHALLRYFEDTQWKAHMHLGCQRGSAWNFQGRQGPSSSMTNMSPKHCLATAQIWSEHGRSIAPIYVNTSQHTIPPLSKLGPMIIQPWSTQTVQTCLKHDLIVV